MSVQATNLDGHDEEFKLTILLKLFIYVHVLRVDCKRDLIYFHVTTILVLSNNITD